MTRPKEIVRRNLSRDPYGGTIKREGSFVELVWKKKQSLGIGVTAVKSEAKELRIIEFLKGSAAKEFCIDQGVDPTELIGAKLVGVNGNRYLSKGDLYAALIHPARPKTITLLLSESSTSSSSRSTSTTDSTSSVDDSSADSKGNKKSDFEKDENLKLRKEFERMEKDHSEEMERLVLAMQDLEKQHRQQLESMEEKYQQQLAAKDTKIERLSERLSLLKINSTLITAMNDDTITSNSLSGDREETKSNDITVDLSRSQRSDYNVRTILHEPISLPVPKDGVKPPRQAQHTLIEM